MMMLLQKGTKEVAVLKILNLCLNRELRDRISVLIRAKDD